MITEIRLMTRQGAATTVRYEGSWDDFKRDVALRCSTDAVIPLAAFPGNFIVNLNELAFATVYAVHEAETKE